MASGGKRAVGIDDPIERIGWSAMIKIRFGEAWGGDYFCNHIEWIAHDEWSVPHPQIFSI